MRRYAVKKIGGRKGKVLYVHRSTDVLSHMPGERHYCSRKCQNAYWNAR